MLTRQEIFDAAQKDAHEFPALNSKDATHEVAFIRGATCANDQNAAEILELVTALRSIIEIGKRDLTNPKYDCYFDSAKNVLKKYP